MEVPPRSLRRTYKRLDGFAAKPLDRATRGSFPDPQKVRSTFCGDSRAPAPLVLEKQSGRRSFFVPLPPVTL